MPTYDFYTDVYLGNQIFEDDFPRLATRAGAFVQKLNCKADDETKKMAICAVAEAWQENERGEGQLSSQTVGSWSQTYARATPKGDNQRLLDAASLYLDGCGTGVVWL